ncbi:SDR family NAD(P)-dependent oxidoreductase [Chloroflexota bacterium]
MDRFQDKVAIVTGAGQGMGRAIALGLAKEGAAVAALDINEEIAKKVAADITAQGGKAIPAKVDITKSREVNSAVEQTLHEYGKVDILINNAGCGKPELFVETNEDVWDMLIATNLKGTIICCRAVLDCMMKLKYGKIVNISSTAALRGAAGQAVYAAAKGGVISFTKALAKEMGKHGINVNCVCPGATDTPLFAQACMAYPQLREEVIPASPLGRVGQPEEVAAVVLFLASDEAGWMVGQTLSASGGLAMI